MSKPSRGAIRSATSRLVRKHPYVSCQEPLRNIKFRTRAPKRHTHKVNVSCHNCIESSVYLVLSSRLPSYRSFSNGEFLRLEHTARLGYSKGLYILAPSVLPLQPPIQTVSRVPTRCTLQASMARKLIGRTFFSVSYFFSEACGGGSGNRPVCSDSVTARESWV
jgi:hypothetical protein